MNEFIEKGLELWEQHKHNGLSITTGRQSGKTMLVLHIANKEAQDGNTVTVFCRNEDATVTSRNLYKEMFSENELIKFKNNKITPEVIKDNSKYKLFDEIENLYDTVPNELYISTPIYTNNFIFGNEWYCDNFIEKRLPELQSKLGTEIFNREFNSNIINKKPINWKERYGKKK